MSANMFVKFSSISSGESLQKGFPGSAGWIEISDFNWEVTAESSYLKGGGAAVGKAVPGIVSFKHYYDKSSPVILSNIVKGVHFDKVEFVFCKQTGKHPEPQEFFRVELKNAFTTKAGVEAGDDGTINQPVEMVCKNILIKYKYQDQDGKLSDAGEFQWDIAANMLLK